MRIANSRCLVFVALVVSVLFTSRTVSSQEWKSGVEWPEPPVVVPGKSNQAAPSDAIVLFDGTNLSQWEGGERWILEDGVAIPREGEIRTKQSFGDIQLHLEWATPSEIEGEGQGRGNSGVFLMGKYEVQVLDSYQNPTYFDGQASSIYKQTPPMANAMRPPGEWNSYDIMFSTPKFRVNGTVEQPAYVTVIHNGVVTLNHFEILGSTGYTSAPTYEPHAEKGPISIQFHNDPVRFRNIWVRELKPAVGRRVSAPFNIQPTEESNQDSAPTSADDGSAEASDSDE